VSAAMESLIQKGHEFTIKSIHPNNGEVFEATLGRDRRAIQLIRDLYMNCRESQRVDQYNPYTWAELHPNLMNRLKEFM